MREIKFRAIMKDKNATVHFTLQDLVNPKALFSIRELLIPWLLEGNQPDRWTGFKDKNKKEIYGGDILKRKDWMPYKGKVEYHNNMASYWVVTLEEELGIDSLEHYCFDNEIEVIGNIYENPELLKVNK